VIARNTAFAYKGKPIDAKTIGRELNIRYVLEGSVQRSGGRMRVNVQLIDAEAGSHLWAERFDKPVADLFDMQDEIVARLAGQLLAELASAEARRAEQAPNPDSMDLCFQGAAWFYKGPTPDNLARARSYFDRALTADPDNVDALIGSAAAHAVAATTLLADPLAAFAAAEAKIDQSVIVSPKPSTGPYVAWTCRHMDEARHSGHRQMRTRIGAGSQYVSGPFPHRLWQAFYRPRGRNRGSYRRGAAPESARSGGFRLDELRGHVEESPRQL
jgi:hypothetical protein